MKIIFAICSLLFIFLAPFASSADTKIDSILNESCTDTCLANNKTCLGITNSDRFYNSSFCDLGDTSDTCNNALGGCNTIIFDNGFNGCTNASSSPECLVHTERQAGWTYCICDDESTTTPPIATSTINKLDIGKEYLTDSTGHITIIEKPFNLFLYVTILFFAGLSTFVIINKK